jgi:hypothetical protein
LSLTGNNGLLGSSAHETNQPTYSIDQSLRFNSSDDPYLARTPSSAGNRKTFTLSFWVKKSFDTTEHCAIGNVYSAGNDNDYFSFEFIKSGSNEDRLRVSGWSNSFRITTRMFRDPSAWFHIVIACDSTQSTANDRLKVYVNGSQETDFINTVNISQDANYGWNQTSAHHIGEEIAGSEHLDGYLAEFYSIDGQALTPASFGETNSDTNQWVPIKYTGSFGSNGYYLKFQNSSALGDDSSGNTNDFTVNNLAATDQVKDSPTNNFATFNPLVRSSSNSNYSEGNLYATDNGSADWEVRLGTIPLPETGKWYWECRVGNGNAYIGILDEGENITVTNPSGGVVWYGDDGRKRIDGTFSSYGAGYGSANVLGVAVDMDASPRTIEFYKDNTSQGSITITGDCATGTVIPYITSIVQTWINFGQDSSFAASKTAQGNTDVNGIGDFYYTPPTGYLALCSDNLPDPAIALPTAHFNTVLYTGNGSNPRSITGVGFQPDFHWRKKRNAARSHNLHDAVRGAANFLYSDATAAEVSTDGNGTLSSFDSDGFTFNSEADDENTNNSGDTYVAWNWKGSDTPTKTFVVTVTDPGSGNRYTLDGKVSGTNAMPITIEEGGTYTFDQSDNTNSGHPLRFSTTSNGTWGGGSEYTTGVTTNGTPGNAGAYTRITVAASAPTLYYYCTNHSGMGAAITTPGSGGGVSDLSGTIASVVNANTTAGMSVVTWTNHNVTVGHGLSQVPELIIIKDRSATTSWLVYSEPVGNGHTLFLNTTGAQDNGTTYFNSTSPTSSVFSVGTGIGGSTDNYLAYCFHPVDGYSSIGQYLGNGAQDGPFVYTGFRPAFIFIKRITNAGSNSYIVDNKRIGYNSFAYATDEGSNKYVWPDSNAAEGNGNTAKGIGMDILSNGFKFRTTGGDYNASSNYYLYYAIAESPFKTANAR